VRSEVEQVDACFAQEMSYPRSRCAGSNGKTRRFDALVTSHSAGDLRLKDEFFRCDLALGSRHEPSKIDDCRLHFQPLLDVQTTTLKPEIFDATRTLSRRPLPDL
jgi:hypothetical protein